MGSYKFTARNRKTDEEVVFETLNDYFGKGENGYAGTDRYLTEEEFHAEYEPVATLP